MNRYDKSQLMRNLNRSNDIEVSKSTKDKLEETAILHLRAGNMTEFAMCMTTIGKIDTVNNLNDRLDSTDAKLTKLIAGLGGNIEDGEIG